MCVCVCVDCMSVFWTARLQEKRQGSLGVVESIVGLGDLVAEHRVAIGDLGVARRESKATPLLAVPASALHIQTQRHAVHALGNLLRHGIQGLLPATLSPTVGPLVDPVLHRQQWSVTTYIHHSCRNQQHQQKQQKLTPNSRLSRQVEASGSEVGKRNRLQMKLQ